MRLLALDVGGSAIKHAISNESGELSSKGQVENVWDNHEDFIEAIGRIFDAAAGQGPVDGVAISTAGELNPHTGYMYSGGALRYNKGTNLIESVGRRVGVRVSLENDGNSALMAEMVSGALKDATNGMVLVLGTGVGGGVMIDRKVYYGSHYHSGNASFLRGNFNDPEAEAFAFTNGAGGLVSSYEKMAGYSAKPISDGRDFFRLLESGDDVARRALEQFSLRMASAIFNIQAILDVDVFAIGGGISAQPALITAIADATTRVFAAAIVPIPEPRIVACRYRNDANLIGAVGHFLATA